MPGAQRQTPPVGGSMWAAAPAGQAGEPGPGKGLTVWGIVLTVIFGIALTGFPAVAMTAASSALAVMSPVIGFGGGLAMIWAGTQRTKKAKRSQVPGPHRQAGASPSPPWPRPCRCRQGLYDLQDMLDSGI